LYSGTRYIKKKLDRRVHEDKGFWREFILLWKNLPELWDRRNDRFYFAGHRKKAFKILLEKMKTVDPDANMERVKVKCNNFRTGFRNVLKTYDGRRKVDKYYKPQLWYFEDLLFLKGNCFFKNEKSPVSNKKGVLANLLILCFTGKCQ